MSTEFKHMFIAAKRLYKYIFGFSEGTDVDSTIQGIKKDIGFRGHTAWILIFSILIASIGLNLNSTAVIIGAMLISPLMGPILGIGYSIGTNDFDTLIRSLKNLGIAISIALFTSTLYFILTPLDIEQTELIARTKPTLLDVLVALFGGFAGIIAGSRKEKTNVIPGVAIATALMPPLCTAGYGLATLKFNYFFGAFYLFFINSVFISLSTFLVVRYLRFPLVEFVSSDKLRRYKFYLITFLIITVTPSVIIFYNVIQQARFQVGVERFVAEKSKFEGSELISYKFKHNDTLSVVDLYYIGNELPEDSRLYLYDKINDYVPVSNNVFAITKEVQINIHQQANEKVDLEKKFSEFDNNLRVKILEDIYTKNEEIIQSKDLKIQLLEEEIVKLSKVDTIPYNQLHREMKLHFPDIESFAYAKSVEYVSLPDTHYYDTVPLFLLNFTKGLSASNRNKQTTKAQEWLQVRLDEKKIKAIVY